MPFVYDESFKMQEFERRIVKFILLDASAVPAKLIVRIASTDGTFLIFLTSSSWLRCRSIGILDLNRLACVLGHRHHP